LAKGEDIPEKAVVLISKIGIPKLMYILDGGTVAGNKKPNNGLPQKRCTINLSGQRYNQHFSKETTDFDKIKFTSSFL
jgi:hypothetical protein